MENIKINNLQNELGKLQDKLKDEINCRHNDRNYFLKLAFHNIDEMDELKRMLLNLAIFFKDYLNENKSQKRKRFSWKSMFMPLILGMVVLSVIVLNQYSTIANLDVETYEIRLEYFNNTCPIRGVIDSGIYHTIESPYYGILKPRNVECFESENEAAKHYRKFKK